LPEGVADDDGTGVLGVEEAGGGVVIRGPSINHFLPIFRIWSRGRAVST
jgi:hypothetical protein